MFDRVPLVIWWVLKKLGVEEWIVCLVQGMYANARSRVRVGESYSGEFEVRVGVHHSLVLGPLFFIIVLEALSHKFRAGVPWEDLYNYDLVINAEPLDGCVRRLLGWKNAMVKKGLRVNAVKTMTMIRGMGLDFLPELGQVPMHCLSHWCRQQQHLLQWLQALSAQEMQQAKAPCGGPQPGAHNAREPCPPLKADRRVKSKLDLTSWRW